MIARTRGAVRRAVGALALVTVLAATAGCGLTATDLPLPGGNTRGDTYELTAVFSDALNLPAKAHVKVDGVRVGEVTDISPHSYTARVRFVVSDDVALPVGTRAELRQATPLGDVFVALQPPDGRSRRGLLGDGDTIGLRRTSAAVSVEDMLGALSLLVNGGGLGQMSTIIRESNQALDGREVQFRHLLAEGRESMKVLASRTEEIDRVLLSTRALTRTATRRSRSIDAAIDEFTPALRTLNRQTDRFARSLEVMRDAGGTADRLLADGSADLVASLRGLDPILAGFEAIDGVLAPTLRLMVHFSDVLAQATKGESLAGGALVDFGNAATGFNGFPTPAQGQTIFSSLAQSLQSFLADGALP